MRLYIKLCQFWASIQRLNDSHGGSWLYGIFHLGIENEREVKQVEHRKWFRRLEDTHVGKLVNFILSAETSP